MQAGEERTSIDSASVARTRELLDDRNMLQRVNECWSIFPSTMSSRIVLYSLMFFPKLRTFQDIDWKNLIVIQRLYAKLSITSDTPTRYQSPLCWPIIIFHDPGQNIPINLRNHLHAKKESPPSIHSPQVNALTVLENTSPPLASRRARLPSDVHQMETLYSSFFDEEARWKFGISDNVQFSLSSRAIVSRLYQAIATSDLDQGNFRVANAINGNVGVEIRF